MNFKLSKLKKKVESHWKQSNPFLSIILLPISLLYQFLKSIHRWLYHHSILATQKHPLPIIVIGNLHAGGTGKTPTVIYLVKMLIERGFKVGIISRGYARHSHGTLLVQTDGMAKDYGDEPLLIAKKTNCRTVVSIKRNEAVDYLISHFPDLEIIISDDGIQHYQMQRDIEIVIFPYNDLYKPLKLIPNGPLREPLSHLRSKPFILISNTPNKHISAQQVKKALNCENSRIFFAKNQVTNFYPLNHPQQNVTSAFFYQKQVAGACAIANPERFFVELEQLGISLSDKIIFQDHQPLPIQELAKQYEYVIITEKDAIKICNPSIQNVFILAIKIQIEEDFTDALLDYLKEHYIRN